MEPPPLCQRWLCPAGEDLATPTAGWGINPGFDGRSWGKGQSRRERGEGSGWWHQGEMTAGGCGSYGAGNGDYGGYGAGNGDYGGYGAGNSDYGGYGAGNRDYRMLAPTQGAQTGIILRRPWVDPEGLGDTARRNRDPRRLQRRMLGAVGPMGQGSPLLTISMTSRPTEGGLLGSGG